MYLELRAEMNVLAILNTCQHPLDPNPNYEPKPVHLSIRKAAAPSPEEAQLVHSTAQVVEALHHSRDSGPLEAARERLEESAAELEARAPNVAEFARRLLDTLSILGI